MLEFQILNGKTQQRCADRCVCCLLAGNVIAAEFLGMSLCQSSSIGCHWTVSLPEFTRHSKSLCRVREDVQVRDHTCHINEGYRLGSRQFPNSVTVRCFAFEPVDDEMSQNGRQKEHLIMFPKCQ